MNKHIQNIRLLLTAQLISAVGDQLTLVASFAALLKVTGDPIQSASPLLIRGIVHLLFGIGSMKWIDQFSSKKILIAADLLRAFLIAALVIVPAPSISFILFIQALCTVIEIFFNSSREKLLTTHIDALIAKQQRHYVSLDNQLMTLMEILGFGLGFLLIAGLDYRIAFGVDAFTFILSVLFLLFVEDITLRSAKTSFFDFSQITQGFQAVFKNKELKQSTFIRSLFWIGAGIFNMIQLKLVSELPTGVNPASAIALSRSLEAVGFTIGLYVVKKVLEKKSPTNEMLALFKTCSFGLFIAALTTFSLIPSRLFWVFTLSFLLHGFGTGYNSFGVRRIRQLATQKNPTTRARVTALSNTMAKLSEVMGMLFVTVVLHAYPDAAQYVLFIGGLAFLAASLVGLKLSSSPRTLIP